MGLKNYLIAHTNVNFLSRFSARQIPNESEDQNKIAHKKSRVTDEKICAKKSISDEKQKEKSQSFNVM